MFSSLFDENSDTKEEPEDDDSSSTSSSDSSAQSDNADSDKVAPGNDKFELLIFCNFNCNIVDIFIGSMDWVQRQIIGGINPRRLLHQVFGASVPSQIEDVTLWRVSHL